MIAALVLTFLAYLPVWRAQFVNWDDNTYVVTNLTIRSLGNFWDLMTVPVQGNYHPLTMLSLALNYAVSGLQPWSYHAVNLIFHLLNTYLVFRLAMQLSRDNVLIAYTVSLLFGIHPMHVESVAWVSERKDVLYSCFFLLGLLSYLKYLDKQDQKALWVSLGWFVLSLASKPAAVIFPVVLFLVDLWRRRQIDLKVLLEKIPFLVLAGLVGYLTFQAQATSGATDSKDLFTLGSRVLFFFYGFMVYFLKMLVPVSLAAFYPFPTIGADWPIGYWIAPAFFVLVAAACWLARKKYPVVAFGIGFYFINLVLVLQLFPVGSAVVAERYTYMPYIGLFFVLGWFLNEWFKDKTTNAVALVSGIGFILMVMAFRQAAVWENSLTLWDNSANTHPSHLAYCLRGNIYYEKKQDAKALADYNAALALKPDFISCLDDRGILYARAGKLEKALADFNRALQMQPNYKLALLNRAITYLDAKQFENAIRDYQQYLKMDPDYAEAYNSIGICYQSLGQYQQSLEPFNEAIKRNSKVGNFYLNRSYTWFALGNVNEARTDAFSARQNGETVPVEYATQVGL